MVADGVGIPAGSGDGCRGERKENCLARKAFREKNAWHTGMRFGISAGDAARRISQHNAAAGSAETEEALVRGRRGGGIRARGAIAGRQGATVVRCGAGIRARVPVIATCAGTIGTRVGTVGTRVGTVATHGFFAETRGFWPKTGVFATGRLLWLKNGSLFPNRR